MKLNLDFYKKEFDTNISDEESKIINNYIMTTKNECYEEKFDENVTDKEMYYLSSSSQNLLNWYQFNKQDSVLEIGGDLGQLTGIFTRKCQDVVTIEPSLERAKAIAKRHEKADNLEIVVGNLQNIKIDKKFDYITLVGIIPREKEIVGSNLKIVKILKLLEPMLKQDGKFLVAVDNKFGLRYFCGNPENVLNQKFESIIGYNNEKEKIETFTKRRLDRQVEKLGFNANFYYPLPDYKMPNVIFSDNQLAKYNSVDKYEVYCNEKSTILMNEIDVFREILKNDKEMFTFFTNSFLLEISKEKQPIKYKYISFNNMRKEEYRLITKIADEYVEKEPVNDKANKHYETIKENIRKLKENGTRTVDYEEEGRIKSKYIKQENLLNNVITRALEEENNELVENIMNKYIENLKFDTYKEENYENTVFAKYDIEIENKDIIKEMHFQINGLWDMTFKNCFYVDGELYFFDQEWKEENLPIEYILYRSILYTISLRRFINIESWFEKYNLTKYKELFKNLDDKLQEEIRNDISWKFYSRNKFFDIDATKQEMINMKIRSEAQKDAIDNLKKENENLRIEYEQYRKIQEKKITNKIKRKVKKIIRRK